MATSTQKRPQTGVEEGLRPYWQPKILGAYRPISVHQLALYWWLYAESHITARQLKLLFALHEVHERRRRQAPDAHRHYALPEISRLIGGGVGDQALTRDLARLTRLGVVQFEPTRITFATRVGQLTDTLELETFWTLLGGLDHPKRIVPVPRRALRALAGGFSRATMGTFIAQLVRCLFWHKDGGYRVDGRTKASWIVDRFGLSRRAVIDARKKLVGLGWLKKLPAEQWEINRWGARFAIRTAGPQVEFDTTSAPPLAANAPQICTPIKQSSSPKGELKKTITRRPTFGRPPGVSHRNEEGSRKKKFQEASNVEKRPTIFDVQRIDLEDATRTEALYQDACTHGKARNSEHARLQFFALAERARAHGQDPCRLFAWLLKENKTKFIAQIDEERGVSRIKKLDFGIRSAAERRREARAPMRRDPGPSNDVRIYGTIMDSVRQTNDGTSLEDVAKAVQERYGWTPTRWEQAGSDYWKWRQKKSEIGAEQVAALDPLEALEE